MKTRVIIALGSNLGDRKGNIEAGLARLAAAGLEITGVSVFRESPPAENVSGGWFINAALLGETALAPGQLLKLLRAIEAELGRPPAHPPGDARAIDLDIIYYGNRVIRTASLVIPHPRRLERVFVMGPAAEIAPDFTDPVCGRTVGELARSAGALSPETGTKTAART